MLFEVVGREHGIFAYIFFSPRLYTRLYNRGTSETAVHRPHCVCELYGYSIRCRRPDRVVMRLCVIRGSQLRVRLYFWPSIRPPRQIYCPTMNRNRVYAPKRFPFIVPYRWPVYDRATFNIPAPRMRLGFEFASDKKLARISINVSRCNCIVAHSQKSRYKYNIRSTKFSNSKLIRD